MKDAIQAQLIAARRGQILDAAARVFASKGFHPTTIKDIAREAGIADGTIYNYFENKTALLLGILEQFRDSVEMEATAFTTVDPTDVRACLRAYLRQPLTALTAHNFEFFRVVMSEIMVNQELRDQFYTKIMLPTVQSVEPLFQQWADQGLIRALDVRLTLRVMGGTIFGLLLEHNMGDPALAEAWDRLPDFIADLLLDGLTP